MVGIKKAFVSFPRFYKQAFLAVTDSILLVMALIIAFTMRLGEFDFEKLDSSLSLFLIIPFLSVPIFIRFGLYRAIIRYIGFKALWAVFQAVSLYSILWGLVVLLAKIEGVPRSVILINWLVSMLFIGGTRVIARWWLSDTLNNTTTNRESRIRVVVYGAGSAGIQLASALSYSNEYKPVAFVDDKSELHNTHANSLRVYPFNKLGYLIEKLQVEEVLLAIPTASRSRRKYIIQSLEDFPVRVRTLPGMADIAGGQVKIEDIKEVDIEDLLGRDPVSPISDLLDLNIRDKVVMVTGAGGSIGSELCRQILKQRPKRLVLFEQNEYSLYNIESELNVFDCIRDSLSTINKCENVIPILGSVLDSQRLEQVCKTFSVNTIYHAAAYKHVPLVEKNPLEAIRNNIIGTLTAGQAAISADVDTFVLISTDKAVRPTNVMGATKRFAELILQGLSKQVPNTRFCMVRFGNVLGSSGSVVPVFRTQIKQGGPITVTHPDIIRYFMTIPEAAQLVIQAGAMGVGGDVFLLDMGEPVQINELARKMIRLSGLEVIDTENPDGDIAIQYTGLRPGEKLYEELLIGNNPIGTKHPRVFRAIEESVAWNELQTYIELLKKDLEASDCESALTLLLNVVSEFNPQGSIEDLTWREKRRRKDMDHVVQLKDFRNKFVKEDIEAVNLKKPS